MSMDKEGRQVASWFNAMGVTAYVLRYRLGPRYHHPIELGDAQRAIRLVRSRAMQLGIAPDRIGMMGFSAGGHLTATAGTHFDDGNRDAADPVDRVSSRPDFLILAYPVISFDPAIAHREDRSRACWATIPIRKLIEDLSDELQVMAKTPPTFLFHTNADITVPAENSVRFYLALRQAKVPAEMHIFENGPHGVGAGLGGSGAQSMADAFGQLAPGAGTADKVARANCMNTGPPSRDRCSRSRLSIIMVLCACLLQFGLGTGLAWTRLPLCDEGFYGVPAHILSVTGALRNPVRWSPRESITSKESTGSFIGSRRWPLCYRREPSACLVWG